MQCTTLTSSPNAPRSYGPAGSPQLTSTAADTAPNDALIRGSTAAMSDDSVQSPSSAQQDLNPNDPTYSALSIALSAAEVAATTAATTVMVAGMTAAASAPSSANKKVEQAVSQCVQAGCRA